MCPQPGDHTLSNSRPHYHGHRQRLKDRFENLGAAGLHAHELLELLLSYAISRKDVKPLAKGLLQRFGNLRAVLDAPVPELTAVAGIGRHAALLLKLTRDCSDVYLRMGMQHTDVISSPQDLLRYCRSRMAGMRDEQFRVIFLNAKNHVIADDVTAQGTVDQTAVYPRRVLEKALQYNAVALIFVHNHPSGVPEPSAQDRSLTASLVNAARSVGITVHDHIIIAAGGHYSFREAGLL